MGSEVSQTYTSDLNNTIYEEHPESPFLPMHMAAILQQDILNLFFLSLKRGSLP